MSVIVFGDLHLDKTEIRLLTVLNFLDYIIDYCKKNPEVKSVINLGDTFHTPQNKNDFFSTFAVQNGDWNVEHQQQKGG